MTRWRVVRAPVSRYQDGPRFSVLGDREGPVMGERGGLNGWTEETGRGPIVWLTFEQACAESAADNGKPSTANMVAAWNRDMEGSVAP